MPLWDRRLSRFSTLAKVHVLGSTVKVNDLRKNIQRRNDQHGHQTSNLMITHNQTYQLIYSICFQTFYVMSNHVKNYIKSICDTFAWY